MLPRIGRRLGRGGDGVVGDVGEGDPVPAEHVDGDRDHAGRPADVDVAAGPVAGADRDVADDPAPAEYSARYKRPSGSPLALDGLTTIWYLPLTSESR